MIWHSTNKNNKIFYPIFIVAVILSGFTYVYTHPLTYRWRQVSGPNQATFIDSTNANTDATGLIAGVYHFELKVTDWLGASGYDTMQVTVNPAVLPITLTSFTASAQQDYNLIRWTTSMEFNVANFVLEASLDGNLFYTVTVKQPTNTTFPTVYEYNHYTQALLIYYRLKSIDKDGEFVYSKIVSVKRTAPESSVTATGNLRVRITSDKNIKSFIKIYDFEGRLMAKKEVQLVVGINDFNFNTGSFASGIYFIQTELKTVRWRKL